jgi:predicted HD phosphohydrolase
MTTAKIERLIDLLNAKGGSAYFAEPVSILEHSLPSRCAVGTTKPKVPGLCVPDAAYYLPTLQDSSRLGA